jgi:hypothetical protein
LSEEVIQAAYHNPGWKAQMLYMSTECFPNPPPPPVRPPAVHNLTTAKVKEIVKYIEDMLPLTDEEADRYLGVWAEVWAEVWNITR